MIRICLLIAIGSALGGVLRFGCSLLALQAFGSAFPWGTLFVNVAGCWLAGYLWPRAEQSIDLRYFAIIGFCGGFTTFSTFSLEALNLARDAPPARSAGYVVLSLALCMVGVWLGIAMGARKA